MENKELTHHGIKGMRWGVRRYQNPDGTLTAKGKKRYSAEMEKLKKEEAVLKNKQRTQAKIDRLLKKRQELDDMKKQMSGKTDDKVKKHDVATKPKGIKDMSDEELIAKINRMRLEQTYKSMMPKETSAGEKFVNKFLKPAGEKIGNKLGDTVLDKINKELRKNFGLDVDGDELKALKKESEKIGYEKTIAEAKAAIKKAESGGDPEYDKLKRDAAIADFETKIRKNEKAKNTEVSGDTKPKKYKFRKKETSELASEIIEDAATKTTSEISKKVKDDGKDYVQLTMFDELGRIKDYTS